MTTTARFALPLLAPGQAQKELNHNEALTVVDALLHAGVEDVAADPPVDPEPGDAWIVAAGATGAWEEQVDSLAIWSAGGWRFLAPLAGMIVWNSTTGCWSRWAGVWVHGDWPVASLTIAGEQIVGPRQPDVPSPSGGTTIDAEARAAIDLLIVTLKSHGLID